MCLLCSKPWYHLSPKNNLLKVAGVPSLQSKVGTDSSPVNLMTASTLEMFCRQIRQRSEENKKAFSILFHNDIIGNSVSILRQELDSMIRVIYLLSIDDIDYRNELIELSVQ